MPEPSTGRARGRRLDRVEALANAGLGLAISVAAVELLWPRFGWQVAGGQSLAVSLIFFGLSTARAYALRRAFRRIERR